MPLTAKGEALMKSFEQKYGPRAEQVFYASRNAGTITGVDQLPGTVPAQMTLAEIVAEGRRFLPGAK